MAKVLDFIFEVDYEFPEHQVDTCVLQQRQDVLKMFLIILRRDNDVVNVN